MNKGERAMLPDKLLIRLATSTVEMQVFDAGTGVPVRDVKQLTITADAAFLGVFASVVYYNMEEASYAGFRDPLAERSYQLVSQDVDGLLHFVAVE